MEGQTHKPNIIINTSKNYVIIGSIDHGMQIPNEAIGELVSSLEGVEALMMETPEELHPQLHPMSTEILTKASIGSSPIHYLSGNRMDEEIGESMLKYAPEDITRVFVPCLFTRNSIQMGQNPSLDSLVAFVRAYKGRFGFLDERETIESYMKVLEFWSSNNLDPKDLDHFSYDFEKFQGDIKEFDFWLPELKDFRSSYQGKVAVCVGDYHTEFVQRVFQGDEIKQPNWETHIEDRREDSLTPQSADFLKNIYSNLERALN